MSILQFMKMKLEYHFKLNNFLLGVIMTSDTGVLVFFLVVTVQIARLAIRFEDK